MEKLARCAVCGQAIAKYVCKKCGANVCEACYDKTTGLCISCRQGQTVKE